MKRISSIIIILFFSLTFYAQENMTTTPYHQIPDYPEIYSEHTVLARMIDGLGYRYYWASKNLRQEDLDYAPPGEDTRSVFETMRHMFNLSRTALLAIKNEPNTRISIDSMGYEELRTQTLNQLFEASELLKNTREGLDQRNLIFVRGDNTSTYPIWNLINGPIADAIYHTGQIVAFRRSSGNPLDPMVSVFMGKNRVPKNVID